MAREPFVAPGVVIAATCGILAKIKRVYEDRLPRSALRDLPSTRRHTPDAREFCVVASFDISGRPFAEVR